MKLHDLNDVKAQDVSWRYRRKLAEGQDLAVAMVEVLKGAATLPHSHDHEEAVLVLEGAWRFSVAGEDVTLRPNQMLSIPPGVEHSSMALEDTVAIDICAPRRKDWKTGEDHVLHYDPDQYLWAV
jgi:quercetin dioxygenase-like cupin family protein